MKVNNHLASPSHRRFAVGGGSACLSEPGVEWISADRCKHTLAHCFRKTIGEPAVGSPGFEQTLSLERTQEVYQVLLLTECQLVEVTHNTASLRGIGRTGGQTMVLDNVVKRVFG